MLDLEIFLLLQHCVRMTQKKGQFKLINTLGHLDLNSAEPFQSGGCPLVLTDHVKCWARVGPGLDNGGCSHTGTWDHRPSPPGTAETDIDTKYDWQLKLSGPTLQLWLADSAVSAPWCQPRSSTQISRVISQGILADSEVSPAQAVSRRMIQNLSVWWLGLCFVMPSCT